MLISYLPHFPPENVDGQNPSRLHFNYFGDDKGVRVSLCTKKRRLLICKHAVFTYVPNPVHKGEYWLVKWWLTLRDHNFVNNGPNLTILVPIDSQDQGLLIGTKMVKIGPLLTKLWYQQVGDQTRLLTR